MLHIAGCVWYHYQWVIKTSSVALFSCDRQLENPVSEEFENCAIPRAITGSQWVMWWLTALIGWLQLAWLLWRRVSYWSQPVGSSAMYRQTGKHSPESGSSSNANRWAVRKEINITLVNHMAFISPTICIQCRQFHIHHRHFEGRSASR